MTQGALTWLLTLAMLLLANAPFISQRLLLVGPRRHSKAFSWRLLELVLVWALALAIGSFVEAQLGQRAAQGWEFFAATACLFLTLAFPGFVWRFLRKSNSSESSDGR